MLRRPLQHGCKGTWPGNRRERNPSGLHRELCQRMLWQGKQRFMNVIYRRVSVLVAPGVLAGWAFVM